MLVLLLRAAGLNKYHLFSPFCKHHVQLRSFFGRVFRFAFLACTFCLLLFFDLLAWPVGLRFLGFEGSFGALGASPACGGWRPVRATIP